MVHLAFELLLKVVIVSLGVFGFVVSIMTTRAAFHKEGSKINSSQRLATPHKGRNAGLIDFSISGSLSTFNTY